MDVTSNPVENGSFITDHVRKKQDVLSVSGKITDTVLAPIPPIPFQFNRAHREWTKFLSFFLAREPVFVATSVRVMSSAIIEKVRLSRTPDSGGCLPIQIQIREIQIASLLATVPLIDEAAAAAGGLPLDSGGTQAAAPI